VNCREAERLIDTFFDGELDGRSMRDAAMHITRCKRCEAEINDRERLQGLLASIIEDEIADIDVDRIWAAVEPTLKDVGARPRWRGGLRLAATSSRTGGLVLGPGRAGTAELDASSEPELWDESSLRRGRVWRWSLASGAALAASVLLAIALLPGTRGDGDGSARVAATGSSPAEVAQLAPPAPGVALVEQPPSVEPPPFALASSEGTRGTRSSSNQVQVESVNFPRSSVAMWSEPASDTTVIWVEDTD
jgi:hypothetical protein